MAPCQKRAKQIQAQLGCRQGESWLPLQTFRPVQYSDNVRRRNGPYCPSNGARVAARSETAANFFAQSIDPHSYPDSRFRAVLTLLTTGKCDKRVIVFWNRAAPMISAGVTRNCDVLIYRVLRRRIPRIRGAIRTWTREALPTEKFPQTQEQPRTKITTLNRRINAVRYLPYSASVIVCDANFLSVA